VLGHVICEGITLHTTPNLVLDVADRLLAASQDTIVYQPTDYHWLVIYDCLEGFCELHNDLAAEQPTRMTPVGAFEIGKIDVEALVTLFFWDTDFLAGDDLVGLSVEQRNQLGIGAETFGLAAGLSPHPDELRLQLIEGSPNWCVNETALHGREIGCFPPDGSDAQ
jgi:hypothetical protein